MKPLLLLLAATLCATLPVHAGEPLIRLDLAGLAPGEPLPERPEATPPLLFPSRVIRATEERVRVVERFENSRANLPGPSVVLEKTADDDATYLEFTFPPAQQPRQGRWKLRFTFLSDTNNQRGNVSLTLRNRREINFYLQIGPSGNASVSHHGGSSTPLPEIGNTHLPAELEILFDFDTGEATLLVDQKPLIPPYAFYNGKPVETLVFGIRGEVATRTIALHELTFTPQ